MAYFPDLTPHVYSSVDGSLNVGWLSKDEPFPTGDVPDGFLARLRLVPVVNLYRGVHACEFCSHRAGRIDWAKSGNGEFKVTHAGVTYTAPALVAHYIEAHRYLPPQGFIDAVMDPEPSQQDRLRLAQFAARALCEVEAQIEKFKDTMISGGPDCSEPPTPVRPMLEQTRDEVLAVAKTWGVDPIDRSLAVGEWAPRQSVIG